MIQETPFDLSAIAGHLMLKLSHFFSNYMQELSSKVNILLALMITIVAISLIEIWLLGWPNTSLARLVRLQNDQKTDLLSALLYNLGLLPIMGIIMSGGLIYFFIQYLRIQVGAGHYLLDKHHPVTNLVIYYIVIDLFSYWGHRIFHKIPMLWILHRYHHSAREMTLFTTFRTHPLYDAVASLWMALPLLFIPAPVESVAMIAMAIRLHTLLLHSNISSDWGWLGKWLIQSPVAHRIHHSRLPAHHDKNFGATLVIWDKLFGSMHLEPAKQTQNIDIGVSEDPGAEHPVSYIMGVYKEFLGSLLRLLVRNS